MFNIFENNNNPMIEEAKIRFLLNKVNHPHIANTVELLREKITTEKEDITTLTLYTNDQVSSVSKLSDYIANNLTISGVYSSTEK